MLTLTSKSKAMLAHAKRNRKRIAERTSTIAYVLHERALATWDGKQPTPKHVRLGTMPQAKGR